MGWMGVLASERGIRRLALPQPSPQRAVEALQADVSSLEMAPARFEGLRRELETCFSGDSTEFIEELDLDGAPPFFLKAWAACRSIPRGETRSYAWLAVRAGSPGAVRAAGQAMAHNPIPIIIPCHRVIASNGDLCGYGGDLDMKQRLLDLERAPRL
ncbi:MAG: methylated-DNA--[protein]-cysteine S-methyltransferase [Dehalococcoidia bacterium]|nr:methylated-DNA--[protein]-cysteine S-methyltransferase [Dehalococcoidia bacterium]